MAFLNTQNVSANSNNVAVTVLATTISAPAVGSLIVTAIALDKNSSTITLPTGFIPILTAYIQTDVSVWIAYRISDGTETSVSWSWVTSQLASAWAGVWTGRIRGPFMQACANTSGTTAVTSLLVGTLAQGWGNSGLAIAAFASDSGDNTDLTRAYTNNFTELAFSMFTGAAPANPGLMIATKISLTPEALSTTFSTTDTGDQLAAFLAVFTEDADNVSGSLWPILVAA